MPTTSKSRIPLRLPAQEAEAAGGAVSRRICLPRTGGNVLEEREATGDQSIGVRDPLGSVLPRLNEIVRGKRAVTPDTALRLARVLGMSGWLGLQRDWDLWHAMRSREASAIQKLEPLRRLG